MHWPQPVVDHTDEVVVAATFVGTEITELVDSATTAILDRTTLATMWHVLPYRAAAIEIWLRLFWKPPLEVAYGRREMRTPQTRHGASMTYCTPHRPTAHRISCRQGSGTRWRSYSS